MLLASIDCVAFMYISEEGYCFRSFSKFFINFTKYSMLMALIACCSLLVLVTSGTNVDPDTFPFVGIVEQFKWTELTPQLKGIWYHGTLPSLPIFYYSKVLCLKKHLFLTTLPSFATLTNPYFEAIDFPHLHIIYAVYNNNICRKKTRKYNLLLLHTHKNKPFAFRSVTQKCILNKNSKLSIQKGTIIFLNCCVYTYSLCM